jgi:hypothetical protein
MYKFLGNSIVAAPLSSGSDDLWMFREHSRRANLLVKAKNLPIERVTHFDNLEITHADRNGTLVVFAVLPSDPSDLAYYSEHASVKLTLTGNHPNAPAGTVQFPLKVKVNTLLYKNELYEEARSYKSGLAGIMFQEHGFPLLSDNAFSTSGRDFINHQILRHISRKKLVCGVDVDTSRGDTIVARSVQPLVDVVMSPFWAEAEYSSSAADIRFLFLNEPISKRVYPSQILFDKT